MLKVKVTKSHSRVRKGEILKVVEIEKDGTVIEEVGRTYDSAITLIREANKMIVIGSPFWLENH